MATRHIKLEEGETIQLSFLPARIAEALHDDEPMRKLARVEMSAELSQMADSGALVVRDALTLEPLSFELGDAPGYGVLTADDLRPLLESKGVSLDIYKRSGDPRVIGISALHQCISVEDTITCVFNAIECPDDVREDGLTAMEGLLVSVEREFLSVCEKLEIKPRLPYDPEEEYIGKDGQSERFEITTKEFKRYAAHYGVVVRLEDELETIHPVQVGNDVKDDAAFALPPWKMQIQAEATAMFKRLRKAGAQPKVHSVVESLAVWCRKNGVKTGTGIYPSAGYIRTHVLSSKHWTPPAWED